MPTGVSDLEYIEIKSLEEILKDVMVITKSAFCILLKGAGGEPCLLY